MANETQPATDWSTVEETVAENRRLLLALASMVEGLGLRARLIEDARDQSCRLRVWHPHRHHAITEIIIDGPDFVRISGDSALTFSPAGQPGKAAEQLAAWLPPPEGKSRRAPRDDLAHAPSCATSIPLRARLP